MRSRIRPTWKRLVLEYAALVAAYAVVYYVTKEIFISFLALLLVLFIALATRPRQSRRAGPRREQGIGNKGQGTGNKEPGTGEQETGAQYREQTEK